MGGKVAPSRENRVNKGRREESKGCVGRWSMEGDYRGRKAR